MRNSFGGPVFWFGLVLFVLVGGELGAVSDGAFGLTDGPAAVVELVVGANLVPWTGLGAGGAFVAGHRKRLGVAGPTVPAAARIEASRAVGAGPDFPVELDL